MASTTEADRQGRTRNRCNGEGYESVALVPLRVGRRTFGLLQINCLRPNLFNPAIIAFLEDVAHSVALSLAQRDANSELEISENRYRSLFEGMQEGAAYCRMLFDELDRPSDFVYLDVNPAFYSLTGLKNVIGKPVTEVLPGIKNEYPELFEIYGRVARSGTPEKIEIEFKPISAWLSISVYSPAAGYFVAVFDNITRRKTAEDSLSQSEQRYRLLTEGIKDVVWVLDAETERFLYVSPAVERLRGYTPEEILSRPFAAALMPEDVPDISTALKAGRDAVAQKLPLPAEYHTKELRQPCKDGSIVWTEVITRFYLNESTGHPEVLGVTRDISERKLAEAERARLDAELEKNQRLESIGQLAGGIAHDFNNLLTGLLGSIEIARDCLKDRDAAGAEGALDRAESVGERAKALARQLLTFSKGGEPLKRVTAVPELLESSVRFALSGSSISAHFEISSGLWLCELDENQFTQLIDNLIRNAREAMPGNGAIKITAVNAPAQAVEKATGHAVDAVQISISDNGPGIPEDILPKIFDPFFTTKKTGHGLGLAIAHSVLRKHGGFITVQSRIGCGTVFNVFLPATRKPQNAAGLRKAAQISSGGRILVMDDEEYVRALLEDLLGRFGYSAVCAANGEEAVKFYQAAIKTGAPFSAAILDLTIRGGMGGHEALAELRKIDPDVKAILSSGYADGDTIAKGKSLGFAGVLVKPYQPRDLAAILTQVIGPADRE